MKFGLGCALFALGLALERGVFNTARDSPITLAVCLAAYLLIGGEVLLRSIKNISHGRIFDENFLMSVSTIGAFVIGEYPEAAAVMLFYQIGETLEESAAGRARASIAALMDIRPDFANRLVDGSLVKTDPSEIAVGEYIVVRPGERVPLDGVVTEGASALDTAALTGEAMPRDVTAGDLVLSGAINTSGAITVRVSKIASESTAAKILRLVEENAEKKSRAENFITVFARYYTPIVVFAAALVAVLPPLISGSMDFRTWVYRALVFLVVSCPCALVISIPLSFFGGLGAASRKGILVKGSGVLSSLAQTSTVVFDKTGTLTRGVFVVSAVRPAAGFSEALLLKYTAGAEACSTHPAAIAIREYAVKQGIESAKLAVASSQYMEFAGKGVKTIVDGKAVLAGNEKLLVQEGVEFTPDAGRGTVIYTAVDGVFAGVFIINDEIKADAASSVEELRSLGVRDVVMLSGDIAGQAEAAAAEAGITHVYGELLPAEKSARLEELLRRRTGRGKVLFAGDGINDAPSLALSDIGVAMGGVGADAAIEAADIVLMTDELSKIPLAIRIARRTRRIVAENIVLALAVKAVIMALGAAGYASIWAAVFGDVGVALLAILNSLRSLRAGS
ncbi:MAG: heavy metal translocating P-type ATPase [Spirochaetaceae bacterium]|nr:heavy metal translocating P-type ATPase [Spirochaetaceae bacterium]